MYLILADTLVLLHLLFVAFVVGGGFLLARWPRLMWLHLPAAAWGAFIEFTGGICPLTPLENHLRVLGGGSAYGGDFVERYLLPVLYPEHLTLSIQQVLGGAVVGVNLLAYALAYQALRKKWARGDRDGRQIQSASRSNSRLLVARLISLRIAKGCAACNGGRRRLARAPGPRTLHASDLARLLDIAIGEQLEHPGLGL